MKMIGIALVAAVLMTFLGPVAARDLAPGEVNGDGPEIFMTVPNVGESDVPHPCKLSLPRVVGGTKLHSLHENALRRWGTVHFHIPGGCTDWDFLASKWQEAIGTPVTGIFTDKDINVLQAQIKAEKLTFKKPQQQVNSVASQATEAKGAGTCLFGVCLNESVSIPQCARGPERPDGCLLILGSGQFGRVEFPYSGGPEMLIPPGPMSKPSIRLTFGDSGIVQRIDFEAARNDRTIEQFQEKFGKPTIESTRRQDSDGRVFTDTNYLWQLAGSRLILRCARTCRATATTGQSEAAEQARPAKGPKL